MDLREKEQMSRNIYVVHRLIHLHALFSSLITFFPFHICPTTLSLSLSPHFPFDCLISMVESHLQLIRWESRSINSENASDHDSVTVSCVQVPLTI